MSSTRSKLPRWLWRGKSQLQQQHPQPSRQSPFFLTLEHPAPDGQPSLDPSEQSIKDVHRQAIENLVLLVHEHLEAMGRATADEVAALLALQVHLRERKHAIDEALRALQGEKAGLQRKLQRILENIHTLEDWGRKNSNKQAPEGAELDVDVVFLPCNGLSTELLSCQSADLATEDLDRKLENMVREGTLPFRLYLEHVRALATRQFFIRASTVMLEAVQVLLMREVEMDEGP